MELIFREGNFLIKTLSAYEELEAAFRLRHEVFCEELKWVPCSPGVKKQFGRYSPVDPSVQTVHDRKRIRMFTAGQ
jgi:N-acyl-L-homoserine lactone synthetase